MFLHDLQPKVKIHCWGGLGSQLYAVALRLELQSMYPDRKFVIVSHENGVTRRTSEISDFFPGSVICIQDYLSSNQAQVKMNRNRFRSINLLVRKLLVELLRFLSISIDGDRASSLSKIRPWTLQIRGHYSLRKLDKSALVQIQNMLRKAVIEPAEDPEEQSIFVHFRLGDLLTLQSKSPISLDRLLPVIQDLHNRIGLRITLFSDSPDEAFRFLEGGNFPINVSKGLSALDTLYTLINSQYFIGTNSKISVWATILDSERFSRIDSYLPYELQHHVIANIGSRKNIRFY